VTERDENSAHSPDTDYERTDMNVRAIALVALATLAYVCLAPFVLTRIYQPALSDVSRQRAIQPPGPVLQLSPAADLAKFDAQQEAQLDGYGWIDRDKGIARIPIAQAMQDLAKRGFPDFPKAPP
jgi:hypothetical protein